MRSLSEERRGSGRLEGSGRLLGSWSYVDIGAVRSKFHMSFLIGLKIKL